MVVWCKGIRSVVLGMYGVCGSIGMEYKGRLWCVWRDVSSAVCIRGMM